MPNLTLQRINCLAKTGQCPKSPYPKTNIGHPFNGNMNVPGSSISRAMRFSAKINVKHSGRTKIRYESNTKNQYGYHTNNGASTYGKPPQNTFAPSNNGASKTGKTSQILFLYN